MKGSMDRVHRDGPRTWGPCFCLRAASQCLLKSHLSCLAIYIYFVLNSAKVKKIGKVTVKNYLNESLLSLFCFIIYGQGSFEMGLI